MIRAEVPRYDELQERPRSTRSRSRPSACSSSASAPARPPSACSDRFPEPRITGLDSTPEMVFRARELGWEEMRLGRMEDPLPDGPWDLVISVLSVHHLDADGKRDLFRRVREQSRALVIGDVVEVAPERRVASLDRRLRLPVTRGRPGRVVRRRGRLGGRRPGGDPCRLRLRDRGARDRARSSTRSATGSPT